ncbi:ATP-binding protein [Desulfopila aestuarii]|uniref:histidine kinase n=1 Tax=Desulfopila aestuarii DSM 18488 TaxID=1121416 RepID=A0A1M7YIA9_9BACT|nr:ATP-binding protein [Desulfopila aestuarii]SHO52365.1 PAS fold-containing protein [Desulfopila aestuarii DSM 18488]
MRLLPKPRSIRQRFTYNLAAVVGGTFVILSVIFIAYTSRSLEKDLQLQLNSLSRLAVNGLSSALWQYNHEYIDDYLDSLFHYEGVVFASVYAENQLVKQKARRGLEEKGFDYFTSSSSFLTQQADILYQGLVIGKLHLALSREGVKRIVMQSSGIAILVLSFIISGIFATMFVLSRKYLFQPLARLESSARSISMGRLDTEIDTSSEDEIGNLARVLDRMIKELTTTMASRDELEAEVIERKKMEGLLRNREQLLNEMGRIARIGGWEHDLIGRRTVWTEEIYRIMELDEDSTSSPNEHLDYYPPKDREVLQQAYQRAIETGEPFDLELQCNTAKEQLFWARIIGHPEFLHNRCVRVKGTFQDITDRKQLEITLRQAQKMESIGTLAGGIAHDFNNILAAVLGYAELIKLDCEPGSPMKQHIDRVVEAGQRAKELVKQILAFSRQTETEESVLQPAVIINEAVKMLRSSLPTTIDIQFDITPEVGQVVADPTKIHQILTNLCTNAFHAMEATGGTLTISLKNKELSVSDMIGYPQVHPGHFVQISVSDTGIGIAPEIMDKIFDPYFTTKEVGKGTGLGLAITHGIVQRAGGFISCKSIPGEGTTFHVYLPIHEDERLPEAEKESADLIQGGHERIFFIDDEQVLAELGKNMLERLGYTVTIETSSTDALETIRKQPDQFDLIITDQTMPGMTGSDLARRILQIRPAMPIIICTGFSSQITEEKSKMIGIKGFAMKPLATKDIASLIRRVLDEKN